jgi:hypothetical protein
MALLRRTKKPVVAAENRSTASTGWTTDSLLPAIHLARKLTANELAISGETFEPANRRLVPSDGSAKATRASRGRSDILRCFRWFRRPFSANCVAQDHSHVFGIVRPDILTRDRQ